eukprot:6485158-Amphidinium_carterae.2
MNHVSGGGWLLFCFGLWSNAELMWGWSNTAPHCHQCAATHLGRRPTQLSGETVDGIDFILAVGLQQSQLNARTVFAKLQGWRNGIWPDPDCETPQTQFLPLSFAYGWLELPMNPGHGGSKETLCILWPDETHMALSDETRQLKMAKDTSPPKSHLYKNSDPRYFIP